jgi:hypothetical protein
MPGFKFFEKLLCWPGSTFSNVLYSLPDALSRIRSRGNVQQLLVCLCVLNNSGSLPIHSEHHRAFGAFNLFEEFSRTAPESGERLNVCWYVKHD